MKDIDEIYSFYKTGYANTLIQQYGMGDFESLWKCRHATLTTWQKLFGCDNLVSSWDGLSMVTPDQQIELATHNNEYGEPGWIHRDQRRSNTNLLDTIQGYLALSDTTPKSYSTIFYIPKTHDTAQEMIDAFHNEFDTYKNRYGRNVRKNFEENDYYAFDDTELAWLRKHCELCKPNLHKGDLLIWASSLPHAATSYASRTDVHDIETRIGTFISMHPKKLLNAQQLSERRKLSKLHLTSSHNVLHPQLFPYFVSKEKYKKRKNRQNELSYDMQIIRKSLIG